MGRLGRDLDSKVGAYSEVGGGALLDGEEGRSACRGTLHSLKDGKELVHFILVGQQERQR